MRSNIYLKILVLFMVFTSIQGVSARDSRTIVNLNGKWKFNIGDDMKWADPKFDDKDWDQINVPSPWEKEGYVGYDGIAWYRKKVVIPQFDNSKTLLLYIRNVDDCDEVYFNGQRIGATGVFPPNYQTAYDWDRKYVIPAKLIKEDGENLIAVRVYDEKMDGGMTWDGANIYYDEREQYLDLNLAGGWKFKLYDNKDWKLPEFDDSKWKTLQVPMSWENQGYYNYDGNAWYRKSFRIPANMKAQKLYLVLGKVDDYDKVFFNGEWIGEVSPSKEKSLFKASHGEYDTHRMYEIPAKLIREGSNVIAVKVYDIGGRGGIYEGPVGILTEKQMKAYKDLPQHRYEYNGREYYNFGEFIGEIFSDIFDN